MRDGDHIRQEALAAELDRICESPAFRHSLRHQQFLRHLLECKLAGRFAELREMPLGIDFFHRPASTYDPKSDPVVRVEAGRLRQRLDRYYHGEGATAPFEILLDKGSYVPVLRVRAAAAVAIGAQPSLVVLPIPPATSGALDRRSAAGFTEEIAQTLSRLPQLRVFGPDSLASDIAASSAEVRERLKVEWIVRGRWLDDRERTLLLELIRAASGDTLMALRIDTAAADALTVHHSMRTAMLHHFVPLLATREGEDMLAASRLRPVATTHDLAAFDLYQRARYLLKQRNQTLLAKAIEHLETAVRADPCFSAAWAELASAYVSRRQLVFDVAQRDPGPARRAAERAIELDPAAGTAYAILAGLAYASDFDWPHAARLFERALAAAPRDANVRCAFATFLMYSARFDESLREYDVVQALDPLDPAIRCHKGALYFYWRSYDRAETLLTQAIELSPHDVYARLLLADTYAQSGRPEESLEASRQLAAIAPDYANSYVYQARALQMLQRDEDAAAIMVRARAHFGDTAITEYEEAMLHVAGGNAESALGCLERHALRKANGAHCIVIDPTFAPLHRDPRWRSMLERVGLPDFSSRL
ncbi:MAG: tetratricopeptide repeat protein [Betaproteobacteria bacterium]|nr:tetratricopeptide repeat protein [Betaproteobacteria bacterium]MDE2003638.1 tetratricopeptide repeat protein [Betaproteobacteria bacterium]